MPSCKLMKMYYCIKQRRSWRVLSPRFNFKLLTVVVVLTYFLILKPASALLLPQRPPSEQTSHQNKYLHLLGNTFHFRLKSPPPLRRSHGGAAAAVGGRFLLQDGRLDRPSPTGYPPPGDNQHFVPQAPSFPRESRGVP